MRIESNWSPLDRGGSEEHDGDFMKRIWLKFQRDIRLQIWRKCVEASHQRWCSFSPSSGQTTKHIVTKRPPGDSWDADESIDMQIKCTERIAKEKLIFFPSADVRPVADETVAQFDGIVCRLRTTETPTVIMDPRRGSLKAKQMIGDTADLSGNPQKVAPRKTKDETPKKIPAAWTFAKKQKKKIWGHFHLSRL